MKGRSQWPKEGGDILKQGGVNLIGGGGERDVEGGGVFLKSELKLICNQEKKQKL